ncbi:MAG: nuclease-related domain-containing protein, partial [Candidatus Theseobacter exili]|nr:nuclease-related domain-containing protein [Candidatus Theseobacter exili]
NLIDLTQGVYHVLDNVMIPSGNKTTQIDHVVVSRFGVFVIETKNYKGIIYGQERDTTWTQYINPNSKYQFMNPLHQNYGHVIALKALLDEEHIYSVVAFKDGVFGKKMPDNVMQVSEVKEYIRGFRKSVISPVRVRKIVSLIQDSNIRDRTTQRNHVKSVKVRKNATESQRQRRDR